MKHYEWQMSNGMEWLSIANDHVLESHYCHPGASGITINTTTLGQVYIDFDKVGNGSIGVQRLTFLPQGETEEIGWYFRDDMLWCEYGTKSSNNGVSSVSTKDVEQQYTVSPLGTFNFTVGRTLYTIDFNAMTQTNSHTGVCRNLRRRPKFRSTVSLSVALAPSAPTPMNLPMEGYIWEFLGNEGKWTQYQAYDCSLDSTAIENHYQQNPQGQLNFNMNGYQYVIDFSGMHQVNCTFRTRRAVRRTGYQQNSTGMLLRWQFKHRGWEDFDKNYCSVSSQDIEIQYKQNPTGTMAFTTHNFSYELDFSAMTQKNLVTNTTRLVRRLSQ